MLQCVVVDDESDAALALVEVLKHETEIEVLGIGTSMLHGDELLHRYKPDILFLDIMLGDSTGFDLLERQESKPFHTVFTTAHSHFAIHAIKAGAFDYLLKPITQAHVHKVVERLKNIDSAKSLLEPRYKLAKDHLNGSYSKIALPEAHGYQIVDAQTIAHVQAQGNYCDLHFTDGAKMTVTRKLKSFEALLEPFDFVRIHHSHLINLNQLKKYSRLDGGKVQMLRGETIYISRFYKDTFLSAFQKVKKL